MAEIRDRQARLPTERKVLRKPVHGGRSASCHSRAAWGSVALAALALAVPLIVAANPVDQTWIPGLYDEADTDQLVSHAISPESWLSVALPVVLCLFASIALARSSRRTYNGAHRSESVARPPPDRAGSLRRGSSFRLDNGKRTSLAVPLYLQRSAQGESDPCGDDDDQGRRQQLLGTLFDLPPFGATKDDLLPPTPVILSERQS
jgi:hypothetical protein